MRKVQKVKKRFLTKKKIVIGILISILLLVTGGIWFYFHKLSEASEVLPYIERDLNTYLSYISEEQYDKAYSMFTDEIRKEQSFEDFKKVGLHAKPEYSDYQMFSIDETNFILRYHIGEPQYFIYQGELSYTDGARGKIEATFILKADKWELYGIEVQAPLSRYEKFNPPQEKLSPTP